MEKETKQKTKKQDYTTSSVGTAARVLAIVACVLKSIGYLLGALILIIVFAASGTSEIWIIFGVFMFLAILVLAWGIPATVIISRRTKNHQQLGLGFSICVLIFFSLITGILAIIYSVQTKSK